MSGWGLDAVFQQVFESSSNSVQCLRLLLLNFTILIEEEGQLNLSLYTDVSDIKTQTFNQNGVVLLC